MIEHAIDATESDYGLTRIDSSFVILAQAAVLVHPCETALDDPAFSYGNEPLGVGGPVFELHLPFSVPMLGQEIRNHVSVVGPVGEDRLESRELLRINRSQDPSGSPSVGDVSRCHDNGQDQPQSISEELPVLCADCWCLF